MDDHSIRLWVKYLAINDVYCEYCNFRIGGDLEGVTRLERVHPLISQLYEDFGDLAEIMEMSYLEACEFSIEKFKHLFRFGESVRVFDESSIPPDRCGYAKFEIKIHADVDSIMAEIEERLYEQFARMYPDAARAALFTENLKIDRNSPKYYLYSSDIALDRVGANMLEKIWYLIWLRRELVNRGVKNPSVVDLILEIKKRRENPLGWYLSVADKREVAVGGFKKAYKDSSESTILKRYQKIYVTLAKGVLTGKFPDFGKVLDLRKLLASKSCEPPPGLPASIPAVPPDFDFGELFKKG